jgi:hypothetical protein
MLILRLVCLLSDRSQDEIVSLACKLFLTFLCVRSATIVNSGQHGPSREKGLQNRKPRPIRTTDGPRKILCCWGGLGTWQLNTSDKTLTRVLLSMPISNNNGNRERVSEFRPFPISYFSQDAALFGAARHCFSFHEQMVQRRVSPFCHPVSLARRQARVLKWREETLPGTIGHAPRHHRSWPPVNG